MYAILPPKGRRGAPRLLGDNDLHILSLLESHSGVGLVAYRLVDKRLWNSSSAVMGVHVAVIYWLLWCFLEGTCIGLSLVYQFHGGWSIPIVSRTKKDPVSFGDSLSKLTYIIYASFKKSHSIHQQLLNNVYLHVWLCLTKYV